MLHTVLFLGAGASAALGLPTTNLLLHKLLLRATADESGNIPLLFGRDSESRTAFSDLLSKLFPGFGIVRERAIQDPEGHKLLPPVTDVLSLIDYLVLTGNAASPKLPLSDLVRLRTLMERGIFELLSRSEAWDTLDAMKMPEGVSNEWKTTHEQQIFPPRPAQYENLLDRILAWIGRESTEGRRVSIVSTNYDIEVEQRLYRSLTYDDVFESTDFGVAMREPKSGSLMPRPAKPRYAVYKLHGSLNWLRCDLCDNLYLNPVGTIFYLAFILGDATVRKRLADPRLNDLFEDGAVRCHCGHEPLRHVIVAPSFVRSVEDSNVLAIWRAALEALRRADRWVIVGYSLPPEDVAIRSMLVRAYSARDQKDEPEVIVVQDEEKEPEKSRYSLIFRQPKYRTGGFEAFTAI